MTAKDLVVANLERCYGAIERLAADLIDDEWRTQSLCPDWTVHGVVSHLAGVEALLVGWLPDSASDPPPFHQIGPFMTEVEALSGPELLDRYRRIVADRRADFGLATEADFKRPSITPVGLQTYGRFMEIRVFDFWVHERDMAVPLGRTTDDGGPAAEMALAEVERSIGYIVGKRIGLPDGMSIAFRLSGGVERDILVEVDGRAGLVESLPRPDVEVSTDSLTFMLLACGRIDPQDPIDDGRITWAGNDEWGEQAARNLRFTM